MKYVCLLIVTMTTVVLMAADPVGRVTSSGSLMLNGKAVTTTAVSFLPLVAGDEIATSGSPAMIYFTDRSRATLEPNSRIKLEGRSSAVGLRVLSGKVDLKAAEGSRINLIEPGKPVAPISAVTQASSKSVAPLDKGRKPSSPPPDPHRPPSPPPPPPPPPPRSPHCPGERCD